MTNDNDNNQLNNNINNPGSTTDLVQLQDYGDGLKMKFGSPLHRAVPDFVPDGSDFVPDG